MRDVLAAVAILGCSTSAADPSPPQPKVGPGCSANGTPRAKLVLDDAASVKLVDGAVAKPDAKGIVHASGTGVTATLELIGQRVPNNRCQYPAFTGYVVVVTLDGPKASDYEFVGISGWSGIAPDWLTRANDDRWVRYRIGNPDKNTTLQTGALFRNKRAPKDPPLVVAAKIPIDTKPVAGDPKGYRGCDQMLIKIRPGVTLNADSEVHIARYGDNEDPAGVMYLMAYLDTSVTGTLERPSTITSDSGTLTPVSVGGPYVDYGQPAIQATMFSIDARCPDGRLPTKITIRAQLPVKTGTTARQLKASVVLEPRPDGQLLPPGKN